MHARYKNFLHLMYFTNVHTSAHKVRNITTQKIIYTDVMNPDAEIGELAMTSHSPISSWLKLLRSLILFSITFFFLLIASIFRFYCRRRRCCSSSCILPRDDLSAASMDRLNRRRRFPTNQNRRRRPVRADVTVTTATGIRRGWVR